MNLTIILLWSILLIGTTFLVRNIFDKQRQSFNDYIEENYKKRQPNLTLNDAIKLILFLPFILLAIVIVWQLLFAKQWALSLAFISFILLFGILYYWSKTPFNWKKRGNP